MKIKNNEVIIDKTMPKNKMYLISLATKEEIESGQYVDINRIKVSSNPRKHGVIDNIQEPK